MEDVIQTHIVATRGTCGGRPRIAGHRIRVQDIVVWHEHMGQSPDEIIHNFPQLSLADVHAALAYYFDHMDRIRRDLDADAAFARKLEREQPSILDELGSRRTAARRGKKPLAKNRA